MKISGSLLSVVLSVALCPAFAKVVWVDGTLAGYDGHDGSTKQLAYRTIQEAVAEAAEDDTVMVRPGVYDSGIVTDTLDNGGNKTVVFLTKRLRIESTDGATVTEIVGKSDPSDREYGFGDEAVRCVTASAGAEGSVIKGFTLRDGRSRKANNASNILANHGGAVATLVANSKFYVVDCLVKNCGATRGGAVYFTTSIRSLFTENFASNNGGSVSRYSDHYASIFLNNGTNSTIDSLAAVADAAHVVHCSFIGNGTGSIYAESARIPDVKNCVAVTEGRAKRSLTVNANASRDLVADGFVHSGVTNGSGTRLKLSNASDAIATPYATLANPVEGDFRPVAGGLCDGTGIVANSTPDWVPAEFRGFDFNGQPLVTEGRTDLGAVRGAVARTDGVLYFLDSTAISLEGLAATGRAATPFWLRRGDAMRQVVVNTDPEAATVFGLEQSGSWNWFRSPGLDGRIILTLPPDNCIVTNKVRLATGKIYVSPTGDDARDGSKPELAKKSLKAAVAAAPDWGVVIAAEGSYANESESHNGMASRVALKKNLSLRGAGAGRSFIVGQKDVSGSANEGCGPSAMRCVSADGSKQTCVIGFTLTGGRTLLSGSFPAIAGGAFCSNQFGNPSQLIDCMITDCGGYRGGVAYGGWLQRCTVEVCAIPSNGSEFLRNVCASSCVIRDNNIAGRGYSLVDNDVDILYNCTFANNNQPSGDISSKVRAAVNCVIHNGKNLKAPGADTKYMGKNYQDTTATVTGYSKTDLALADASLTGCLKPLPTSVLVGGGSAGDGTVVYNNMSSAKMFAMVSCGDVEGNPFFFKDGNPTAGAYQKPVAVVEVVAKVADEIANPGTKVVDIGGTLELEATGDAKRHLLGFTIDGTFVETDGKTYSYVVPDAYYTAPLRAEATYATDWYVAPDGDDDNDGWTPETARRTLVGAMVGPVTGDTVHAAAGVYAEKTAPDAANSLTRCRVTVPAGVTLAGANRATTIIEGAAPPSPDQHGLGDNATRGVYLNAGAKVCGFTKRNGSTRNGSFATESFGGGVCGADYRTCLVEDCLVTQCRGSRSGAGHQVTFNRCRLINNYGASTGAAGRECAYRNTFISGCAGDPRPLYGTFSFVNCVLAADNASGNAFDGSASCVIVNSAILKAANYSYNVAEIRDTVFVEGSTYVCKSQSNVVTKTAVEIALDAEGRPSRTSCLIDQANASVLRDLGNLDVDGGQRVYNGALDIGCCEFDWRPVYAKDMGSRVVVTSADPIVREVTSKVFLTDGEVVLNWTTRANAKRKVHAEVTGRGELALYADGEEDPLYVWRAGDETIYAYRSATDVDSLRFVYEPGENDAGGAFINQLEGPSGLVMIIR